jgi:hypothetical protein
MGWIAALTVGGTLRGTWMDRSTEYLARMRGDRVFLSQLKIELPGG